MIGNSMLIFIFLLTLANSVAIIYGLILIRKMRSDSNRFTEYLKMLDDKNYRLWKAKLKAEEELEELKKDEKNR